MKSGYSSRNVAKPSIRRAIIPIGPTIHNNTSLSQQTIEAFPLVGIHVNNWQQRTIRLFADPESDAHVYSIGRFHDGSAIVLSREALAECMNFRIAIDYWKNGNKIYTRD